MLDAALLNTQICVRNIRQHFMGSTNNIYQMLNCDTSLSSTQNIDHGCWLEVPQFKAVFTSGVFQGVLYMNMLT